MEQVFPYVSCIGMACREWVWLSGSDVACREWLCIAYLQQDRDCAYRELGMEDKLITKTLEATLVSRIEGLSCWPQILPMTGVNGPVARMR